MQFPTEVPIGGYPSSSDGSTNNQLQQRRRPDLSSPASLLNPGPLHPGYQQPSTPTSPAVASVNRNDSNTSSTKEITADQFIRKQIQNIRTELNLLISIPFLLLVGYGGRPALLILSFGSIACYVLDILEAVEGTIIAFFLTMIMFLGALIYATSDALQESFYNIILLPTFIITIIIFFIVGISHFNVALNESSILMNVMIQITFAVTPLLFGSLVSAILCDDILDFDLQTCFTFLYFLYTWYYCRPRYLYRLQYKKVGSKITAPYSDMKRQLMIPSIVMPIIYLMPIIISFLLQLSLHHNVLTSERHRIIGITQSILLPALLMCFTYQQHENQAQQLLKDSTLPGGGKKEGGDVVRNEDMKIVVKWVFRLLLALYIILSVESHPFFDEMKHFAHVTASSASSSSGPYASSIENLLFTAVIFFLFIIYLLMEKIHEYQSNDIHSSLSSDYDDISPYNTSKQLPDLLKEGFGVKTRFQLYYLILRLALDGSIGCLVGLVAYLFNFPRSVIPIAVIGSVAMMELHFFHDTSAVFSRFLLALLAITSTSLTMITFTKGTVYYLLYSFHSYFYGSFQLSQFSWIVTILMSSAIILPVFLRSNQKKGKGISAEDAPYETFSLSDNPRSNSDDVRAKGIDEDDEVYGDPTSSFFSAIFSTGLIVFMLIVTWLELTMMEQDWSGLEVTSEIVYPTYFFILTMVLSGWIGFMLYSHRSIGFTTLGNIAIIQATKLLHFFYHSSYIIIPASILLISNLLPFFRQYSYYQRYVVKYQQSSFDDLGNTRQQKKNNTTSPFISWNEVVVYVITNAIIYQVFSANLSRWFLRQLFSFFNNTFTTSTDEEVVVVGSRQISRWQVLFFSLALFIMYVSSILFVFQKKQKFIRSILMGVSILLVMISFEGFGLLRLNDVTDDPVVLTANSVNGHFLSAYDHSTFFMLMTIVMTLIAWSRLIALDSMLTCLFYSLIFGFISTKAMINWAFPYHSLVTHPYYDQHHHHHHHHTTSSSSQQVYYYPFCFLYVLKVLNTFIALWNPKNSSHSVSFTTLFPLIYLVTLLWPLVNLIISLVLLENQDVSEVLADLRDREEIGASAGRETDIGTTLITNKMTVYTGIILSTLIGHLTLTASFRLKEVLNYMRDPRETIYSSRIVISFLFSNSSTHQGSSGGYPLVLFHAFVTIAWGVLVILFGMTSIDYDIFFPVVSAILLLYDSEIEVERIPFFASCFKYLLTKKRKVSPWQLWTLINVSFWLISFIYHVFVMDFPLTSTTSSLDIDSSYYKHLLYLTRIKPYSWLNFDSNVSIWSSESALTPVLNVTYLLFTLPAIYYAIWNASTYAVNKTNQYTTQMTGLVSDDVMFLLSVLTLVSLIGANVDCLRYLALIGGLHGVYRSNYLFRRQKLSNDYL